MKILVLAIVFLGSGLAIAESQPVDLNQLESILGQQSPNQNSCAPTDGNSICDERLEKPCCDSQSVCSTDGRSPYGLCD